MKILVRLFNLLSVFHIALSARFWTDFAGKNAKKNLQKSQFLHFLELQNDKGKGNLENIQFFFPDW